MEDMKPGVYGDCNKKECAWWVSYPYSTNGEGECAIKTIAKRMRDK
jgi:hypothetical protein